MRRGITHAAWLVLVAVLAAGMARAESDWQEIERGEDRGTRGGTHRLSWQEANDAGPIPRPGVVRIPRLRGSFAFAPAGIGETKVVYELDVDFGGQLPAVIVRTFVPSQMKAQMRGLRGVLAELPIGASRDGGRNRS